MAVTPEQVAAVEATERYARAQAYAFGWMERAQEAEERAVDIVENQRHRQGWPGLATDHRKVAERAITFARAWARVASVLVPPLEPVWSTLEVSHDRAEPVESSQVRSKSD
ncbi:hypothetical protein [Streptomyces sp. NPDC102487]|uniref:hypothetical protein n=1 Tax=Streptomyces sp. NPDC102487 TaxID=3366182 RepID=UPI0038070C83